MSSIFLAPATTRAAEPDPLLDLVTRLSTQDALPAADLARLATLTAERGEADPALQKGVLRDALAAVSVGEKSAPKTADWPALRHRLETLLNPPPTPEQQKQPDQPKPEDQSPPPEEKSEGEKQEQDQPPSDSPGTPSPSSAPSPSDSSSAPKPSSEALGELNDGEPQPSPAEPEAAPEPTQRAGGVSASGQPREASESAATDPALAVPQQRLDRVRDADSPAQLFKLIQDSELPPEARERAAAGRTRDW